jgi:hypothetical protein
MSSPGRLLFTIIRAISWTGLQHGYDSLISGRSTSKTESWVRSSVKWCEPVSSQPYKIASCR